MENEDLLVSPRDMTEHHADRLSNYLMVSSSAVRGSVRIMRNWPKGLRIWSRRMGKKSPSSPKSRRGNVWIKKLFSKGSNSLEHPPGTCNSSFRAIDFGYHL